MSCRKELLSFYLNAKQKVIEAGYRLEIEHVNALRFEDMDSKKFLMQYVFVVISSGMKNQVAEKIFKRYLEDGSKVIGHPGKRKAVIQAQLHHRWWFRNLKSCGTVVEKLEYLRSLPWIGPVTVFHLARNIGLDVAKPDRHLQRLAYCFGYEKWICCNQVLDVQTMCSDLSKETGERIGSIDVVLWRFSNLFPNEIKKIFKQKQDKSSGIVVG